MEPLSITGTCVGLLASIAKLSMEITSFVGRVRDSRKDMDAVRRELSSLSFCVESLRDDTSGDNTLYPDSLKANLISVLTNCNDVMLEIDALLQKSSQKSLGKRLLWAASTQDEINKLRSRLEAHKATIEIALDMASIFLITTVKQDTSELLQETHAIKQDTAQVPGIKEDTSQLLAKISALEDRLFQTEQLHQGRMHILQRFLDSSTTYAETLIDSDDDEAERLSAVRMDEGTESSTAVGYEVTHEEEQNSGNPQDQHRDNQAVLIQQPDQRSGKLTVDQVSLSHPTSPQPVSFVTPHPVLSSLQARAGSKSPPPNHHSTEPSVEPNKELENQDQWKEAALARKPVGSSTTSTARKDARCIFRDIVNSSFLAQAPDEQSVNKGDAVTILGQVKSGKWSFVRVERGGKEGWILTRHLTTTSSNTRSLNSDTTSPPYQAIDENAALTRLTITLDKCRSLQGFNPGEFIEKVGFFLDSGADVNDEMISLMNQAVGRLQSEILHYVLPYCGGEGPTKALYHIISRSSHLDREQYKDAFNETMDVIIAAGVDLNHGSEFSSPLDLAAKWDNWDAVVKLVSAGAKTGLDRALYEAIRPPVLHSGMKVIRLLVESGASVNYASMVGSAWESSTLSVSVDLGHAEIVRYLIAEGADVLAKQRGLTALELARARQLEASSSRKRAAYREIIGILERAEKRASKS